MRQAAARCGELGEDAVHAAALRADGREGDGVAALGQPFGKLFRLDLLHREEEGKLLLPCAVDLLGGLRQAASGRKQQGDLVEVGVLHPLPGGAIQLFCVRDRGHGISCRSPVVDAVHGQTLRDQARCGGEQPGVGHFGGIACNTGQCLPQLCGGKDGIAAEQQCPSGVRIRNALECGLRTGVIQCRRAFFVGDQLLCRLPGGVGVLHQTQVVDAAARRLPPQKQAAGSPIVNVKASAGQGGGCTQAIGAPGAVEERFVAGHGTGQGEFGEEIFVRYTQLEHQRLLAVSRYAQSRFGHCAAQHGGTVLDGGKLHCVGGVGLGPEHPPEGKNEIVRGDGIFGGGTLGGGIAQAVFEIEGVGAPIGRDLPAVAQLRLQLAVRILPDKAAVQVLAGDHVRCGGCHLRIQIGRDGVHKPSEAVGGGTAADQREDKCGEQCRRKKFQSTFQGKCVLSGSKENENHAATTVLPPKCNRKCRKRQLSFCGFQWAFGAWFWVFRCQRRGKGVK